MMNSTCNWLRQHRLAAMTAAAALTALMVAPDFADAGHRRRARRCCCGHASYASGYSSHGYASSSYGGGYGYNNTGNANDGSSWSHSGYADSGIQYQNAEMNNFAGDPQPSIAQNEPQGERITANRPNLDADEGVPPAPALENDAANRSDASAQNPAQQNQQLRERIQTLQQENSRLKQQLEDARQENRDRSEADSQERSSTDAKADASVETNADAEATADKAPKLPEVEARDAAAKE